MNPYAKGLGSEVYAQSAPTSAGKVATHFNSPYMKAISQNLMTAIYGSPQDDLTRQRIEQSKAYMANIQQQMDARGAEAEKTAAIADAWASKDRERWISLMGPDAFQYISSSSSSGKGKSSSTVTPKQVLEYQEMAQDYANANIKGFDKLDDIQQRQLMNDLAISFYEGNFTPEVVLDRDDGLFFGLGPDSYGYTPKHDGSYWSRLNSSNPVLDWFGQSSASQPAQPYYGFPTVAAGTSANQNNVPTAGDVLTQPVVEYRAPTMIGSAIDKVVTEEIPDAFLNATGAVGSEIGKGLYEYTQEGGYGRHVDGIFDGAEALYNDISNAVGPTIGEFLTAASDKLSAAHDWVNEKSGYNLPDYRMISPSAGTPEESRDPYVDSTGQMVWDSLREGVKQAPSTIADAVSTTVDTLSQSPYVRALTEQLPGMVDRGIDSAKAYGQQAQLEELLRLQQDFAKSSPVSQMPMEYAIPVTSEEEAMMFPAGTVVILGNQRFEVAEK